MTPPGAVMLRLAGAMVLPMAPFSVTVVLAVIVNACAPSTAPAVNAPPAALRVVAPPSVSTLMLSAAPLVNCRAPALALRVPTALPALLRV